MRHVSIAFIGDLTVDTYPKLNRQHLGGASLNAALWAIRSGAKKVSILAGVGHDEPGRQFIRAMDKARISHEAVVQLPGATSVIEIFVDSIGEHTWGEWKPGVMEEYHLGDCEFDILKTHEAAALTVYGKTRHLFSELSAWGREETNRPFLAVNFDDLSQLGHTTDVVSAHIGGIDAGFFGLDKEKDNDLITHIAGVARDTGKLMVVTTGKHGAVAFQGNSTYNAPVSPVQRVVDTTGAGDAFLAGFLVSYIGNRQITTSLAAGNALAAQSVQLFGAFEMDI